MYKMSVYLLLSSLTILYFGTNAFKIVKAETTTTILNGDLDVFLPELHNLYSYAVHYDKISETRRFFRDGHLYMARIERVQDVNGMKTHLLTISDGVVESKQPRIWAYKLQTETPYTPLNKDEFAKALNIIKLSGVYDNEKPTTRVSKTADVKFKYFSMLDVPVDQNDEERNINENMIKEMLNID